IEGLVHDGEGGWWMGEEYSPSLVHFNEEGKMLRRLTPGKELPRMYADRKANRGFEGIAKIDNKVFGFLQSPIPKETSKDGEFSRIVEVDLDTMKTSAEYFYLFEKGNDKIGDAVAVGPKSFLVVEQNGKIGEHSQKYIYRITLGESDQLVKKTLIADLKETPFNNIEKVEGIALIDEHRLALVYDNDFQINGKTNHTTGLTPLNDGQNQLLIMEFTESLKDESAGL
ncbi:MAG: esterase-like activity of phytase family protein, partial [Rhizobacter sp.]|nr:esterase-like activity of phytase family protein [Bacteriovorax sp.]